MEGIPTEVVVLCGLGLVALCYVATMLLHSLLELSKSNQTALTQVYDKAREAERDLMDRVMKLAGTEYTAAIDQVKADAAAMEAQAKLAEVMQPQRKSITEEEIAARWIEKEDAAIEAARRSNGEYEPEDFLYPQD